MERALKYIKKDGNITGTTVAKIIAKARNEDFEF